jgi:hypothetical protein
MDKQRILSHAILITGGSLVGVIANSIISPRKSPVLAIGIGIAFAYGIAFVLDMRAWNNAFKGSNNNDDNSNASQSDSINPETVIYPINE